MDLGVLGLAESDVHVFTVASRRLGSPFVYLEPWDDETLDDAALWLAFSVVGIYLQHPILAILSGLVI